MAFALKNRLTPIEPPVPVADRPAPAPAPAQPRFAHSAISPKKTSTAPKSPASPKKAPAKPRAKPAPPPEFVQPTALSVGRKARLPDGRIVKIASRVPGTDQWNYREVLKSGKLGDLETGPDWLV